MEQVNHTYLLCKSGVKYIMLPVWLDMIMGNTIPQCFGDTLMDTLKIFNPNPLNMLDISYICAKIRIPLFS